uniref:Guanine nucleotide-binding protein-like 1 n=1 Tax=Ciona savignyi TaxID=51511 RepID=H2Z4K8_CIOSA
WPMPRKKPFSGKQKKQQLQDKRVKKGSSDQVTEERWKKTQNKEPLVHQSSLNPSDKKGVYDPNRYHLNFLREPREEIEKRKLSSQRTPIVFVDEIELETDINDVYKPGSVLDVPVRPEWKYTMSKQQVERKEEVYFNAYLSKIYDEFGKKNLSYFEHNLETWRQAWRVWEMSDIIVMVTDVRHPTLHFSPALYEHVTKKLMKPLILILNKIDLVPASVVSAWTSYFKKLFPELHIVWFTSFPQDVRTVDPSKKVKRRPLKKRVYTTQFGPKQLLRVCASLFGDKYDLTSWALKIEADLQQIGFQSRNSIVSDQACGDSNPRFRKQNLVDETTLEEQATSGLLTIGFVGHPNVGKSSLMNGLIGHKVVSTSVTPGHTKYFQTYFLTKTVKLCDSPGLVFPSLINKQLQILSGIYPIAQVQEPYTAVGFLAARIPLVTMLQLKQVERPMHIGEWTAWEICEAWAEKRNYRTAKAARPDVYRAANSILRMAVDGRLCMFMRPVGYTADKEYWENHKDTMGLLSLQATGHFHGSDQRDLCSSDSFCSSGDDADIKEEEEEFDAETFDAKDTASRGQSSDD